MQKSKMAVWGGLTNSCEKKRGDKDFGFGFESKEKTLEGLSKGVTESVLLLRFFWILVEQDGGEGLK